MSIASRLVAHRTAFQSLLPESKVTDATTFFAYTLAKEKNPLG